MSEQGKKTHGLPLGEPDSPPAFGCVVYLSQKSEGSVSARVANLDGVELTAASEREALAKIVPLFRDKISAWVQAGEAIPWIDPIEPPAEGEYRRFLPVHL